MSVVEQAIDKLRRTEPPVVTISPAPRRELPGAASDVTATHLRNVRQISVDRERLRNAGYLPAMQRERQFADHYRQIKRPLIANVAEAAESRRANARLIMVASALPGDGKTFTSINLALSIARERDVSVVLVDGDVAKPHVSGIFGIDQEPGLLAALSEHTDDVDSFLVTTDIPGLSLLPAGKPHEGSPELIASERMARVMALLTASDPKRIILFDSPPLLVSSESRALVKIAGQMVLVVRAGKTPRQAVLDAIGLVGESCPINLVLNQGTVESSDGYYGYGYGATGN